MKKLFTLLCICLCSIAIHAEVETGTCGDNLTWSYDSETKSLTITGSGAMTDYSSSSPAPWYHVASNILSVSLSEELTSIGKYAFSGCSGLTSVSIPDSVTYLGDYAFRNCAGLTSIIIPDGVTNIRNKVFYQCSGLTSVIWNAKRCNNFTENTYGPCPPFSGCSQITSFRFGNEVEHIPAYLCENMPNLTSITIPQSVTNIGSYAFMGCSGLTSIVVESGDSVYDSRDNCNAIIETATNTLIAGCQSTVISESVTSIKSGAFQSCSNLTSVTIPESVTSIGSNAFYNCSSLTSIIIPESIASIGENAFYKTPWYNNLSDGIVYIGKTLYKYKGTMPSNTSIVVQEGTIQICAKAFDGCSRLVSVIIPESVTSIGSNAFYNCSSLTSIIIPKNVTSIGYDAFLECSGLTSVIWNAKNCRDFQIGTDAPFYYVRSQITSFTFGDGVEHIPVFLCYGMSELTSITIPKSVTSIGKEVFLYCSNLAHIISLNVEPPHLEANLGGSNDKVIIVPQSAVAAYQSAPYWKNCNISSCGFDAAISTTPTKAKISASYLGNTVSTPLRFGCVFEHDTIWQMSTSDSIVWQLEELTPDTTYRFSLYGEVTLDTDDIVKCIRQDYNFHTKSTTFSIDFPKTTQSTATARFIYDFGDAGMDTEVDYIQGYIGAEGEGDWRLYITAPRGSIDTTFTNLRLDEEYELYCESIVLKSGEKIATSIARTFHTQPIALEAPSVAEYGQTYATINCNYDYGDAPLVRNVLEFKLSAEEDADVVLTANVTDKQTKVSNLLPNTTYYYRHVLETEDEVLLSERTILHDFELHDFESTEDREHWHFINGSQYNQWVIGTSAGSSNGAGSSALYVSSGTSYSYANRTSTVWAYCDDILEGNVTISFDWQGTGESLCDYMYAYLVPVNANQPTAGSTTAPEGAIQIGSSFDGQSSWTTFTDKGRTLTGQYQLYFMWCNNGSISYTPIAIDNVTIYHGIPDWQFTTLPITLSTQPADGISNTSALLHGTIDCDQESYTEVGFEWKYSDAPATYQPQRLLVTNRVDENLLFRLEGLDSKTFYDFRTFCSYLGETYYGEWIAFRTTSDAVVVAPTVQTVGAEITEQGVEMEGFVVAGTEPMLQQGFEVWVKGTTNVLTTVAEGTIMHAFIPELRSYTTYQYRAYAKTAAGTTYGATLEIETGYIKQNVQDVTVTPSATEATITWTVVEDAAYYLLTLFADEAQTDTIGVYEVGTDGVITRRNKPGAVQSLVNCLVEELEPDTDYFFSVVAYNAADQKVAEETGWFATELPTSLVFTTEEESGASAPTVRKILYKGQVLILRDGKAYNLFGQEVR